jgi:hypothetical protein
MGEWDLAIGFFVGLVAGAYGAYLANPIIEMGVGLMKRQKLENKRIDAEEKLAKDKEEATKQAAALIAKTDSTKPATPRAS